VALKKGKKKKKHMVGSLAEKILSGKKKPKEGLGNEMVKKRGSVKKYYKEPKALKKKIKGDAPTWDFFNEKHEKEKGLRKKG